MKLHLTNINSLAVMQEKPFVCECGKPFSPGQAMRCRCCQGARTVCHDISVESGWRACVHKSGQASTREPADNDLQGASFFDPALVNGKRVEFRLVDLAGSIGAHVMIVDPMFDVVWMRLRWLANMRLPSVTSMF